MNYPHRNGGAAARSVTTAATPQWTVRRAAPVAQPSFPTRRFDALALMPDGGLAEVTQRAPAHPVFEGAFSALARGTIMATEEGPTAVEDLLPGTRIETRDDGYQTLLWIGTISLMPNSGQGHAPVRLFRIPVDSFGPSRPMPDLMLAPHARLLYRSSRLQGVSPEGAAMAPVPAFEDGYHVIRVAPVSPVNVYHLAFADHQILRANGLEIESFHPGEDLVARIGNENLRTFQSFFPHMRSLADFGPMRLPHLSVEQFESLSEG